MMPALQLPSNVRRQQLLWACVALCAALPSYAQIPDIGARIREAEEARKRIEAITAAQKAAPETVAQEPASLAGAWIGLYQVYPSYVQMTLTISAEPAAGSDAPAQIRVEGLEGKNAPHMGVGSGTVRYQPDVRTLDIAATGGPFGRLLFHAVYDVERRVFAGYRVGASMDASPYFLLVRQGRDEKYFDRIKDMPNGVIGRPRASLGLGNAPSGDVLRSWASQILKEYPTVDPYQTESGSLYLMARNLFRDEYFKSFFGKSYDELGDHDLAKVKGRLDEMPPPRSNFPEERANGAARSVARGFWVSVGTGAAPDIMLSVVATRSISAWMNQTLQRLGRITPGTGVFRTLNALHTEESAALGTFWPSERDRFVRALDDRRAQLADPVLTASVDQQVAAATSFSNVSQLQQMLSALVRPGVSPARQPVTRGRPVISAPAPSAAGTGEDLSSVSGLASDAVRTQLRAKVEQAISTLVVAEAGRDDARVAALSTEGSRGASGLDESGRLYQQLQTKYASFGSVPAVRSLFDNLGRRRAIALQGAQPELEAAIRQANAEPPLDELLSRYLYVPSDRTDPVGARLIGAAETKKGQIRTARQEQAAATQRAEATRQRIRSERVANVAARRSALRQQYGVYLPTLDDLFDVLRLVPSIAERTAQSDENRFIAAAENIGFELVNREIFADFNEFKNRNGNRLSTTRIEARDGSGYIFAADLTFAKADRSLIELYAAELAAGYREMRKSTFDVSDREVQIVAKSPEYIKSGSTVYSYKVENGDLKISAMLNNDGTFAIDAERLDADTLRVNSYYLTTDVSVRRGDRLHLAASGQVTLGVFAGKSGPNGIDGFDIYKKDRRFRLGALIGRIGDGDWFVVGSSTTVTASESGFLSLRINDSDPDNNEGAFDVDYSIDPPTSRQ